MNAKHIFGAIALCLFCAPGFAAPKILPIAPYRTAVSIHD
jgi:hypothetical protein